MAQSERFALEVFSPAPAVASASSWTPKKTPGAPDIFKILGSAQRLGHIFARTIPCRAAIARICQKSGSFGLSQQAWRFRSY